MLQSDTANYRKLGIVIPTTGNITSLRRCIISLLKNSDSYLLSNMEIIVYFNSRGESSENLEESIQEFFQEYPYVKWQFVKSEVYCFTAEESAFYATQSCNSEYLYLVGDKRIFLPEGLKSLSDWLIDGKDSNCAYFNSMWQNQDGRLLGQFSTLVTSSLSHMSYKELVMKMGYNFMPTAMGSWVYKRDYLDRDLWEEVIKVTGGHFSHVCTLLSKMGDAKVDVFPTPIFMAEQKNYHIGDSSEWERYSRLTKKLRYFPWTLGLVRQFEILLKNNSYTVEDLRRSMCSEVGAVRRQINEVLNFVALQVLLGRKVKSQKFSESEFREILDFLTPVIPERSQILSNLQLVYESPFVKKSEISRIKKALFSAINQDHGQLPLGTLIVSRLGNRLVRLHPNGYVVSKVSDVTSFLDAYRLLSPNSMSNSWSILESFEEVEKMSFELDVDELLEWPTPYIEANVRSQSFLVKKLENWLLDFKLVARINDRIPLNIKKSVKQVFRY